MLADDGLPVTGFLRENQLLEILPFSHATLWALVRDSRFPAPYRLGKRITAWRVEDVRTYIANPEDFQTPSRQRPKMKNRHWP